MALYEQIKSCRVCGGGEFKLIFDFGNVRIVAFPKTREEARDREQAPLSLIVCENCKLVQLAHNVQPDKMYREFFYRSGINEMMAKALELVRYDACKQVQLKQGDAVLDIGCNDGTLLKGYNSNLVRVGIDPATNITTEGTQAAGWKYIPDYFSAKAVKVYAEKYKIVTAIAMFYDLPDPVGFCREVKEILDEAGVFVIQMNYLPKMISTNGVDNISHEHLTYFTLTTLFEVVKRAGLQIFDADLNSVNGGSLRVYCCHATNPRPTDYAVHPILNAEESLGYDGFSIYQKFGSQVKYNLQRVDAFIKDAISRGKNVYGYGASTRGTTLLHLLEEGHRIKYVAERDSNKLGRYMVAGSFPEIISEDIARDHAGCFLCLPWHFWQGIQIREQKWIDKGGEFILPLPIANSWREGHAWSVLP